MKVRALLIGCLAGAAVAAGVLLLRAAGKDGSGGFLWGGPLLADVNLLLEILLVLGLTVGAFLARAGSIEAHRINQTAWVLVNAALVAFVMASSMATFRIARLADLANPGNAITVAHAVIGALTLAGGLWLVLQMNDVLPRPLHVRRWKTLMRLTLAGYWAVALLGLATYRAWYE